MHQDGKTIREIASAAHMSFGDIAKVIRRIGGPTNDGKEMYSREQHWQDFIVVSKIHEGICSMRLEPPQKNE